MTEPQVFLAESEVLFDAGTLRNDGGAFVPPLGPSAKAVHAALKAWNAVRFVVLGEPSMVFGYLDQYLV